MANLIKKIHIKNYRSIIDETIEYDACNIFVGKNDAGKSNVLKALNLFFNPRQSEFSFRDDFCIYHKTRVRHAEEIVIELTVEIPSTFTDKGELRWKRVWRSDGYRDDFEEFSKEFTRRSRTKMFLNNIHFEYIPAVKSSDYYRYLLRRVYGALLKASDTKINEANNTYSDTLSSLTREITKEIKDKLNIISLIKMPDNLEQLFGDLAIKTKEGEYEVPLSNRGDGIQARHIPAILQFVAKQEKNADENNISYSGMLNDCFIYCARQYYNSTLFWIFNRHNKSLCFSIVNGRYATSNMYNFDCYIFVTSFNSDIWEYILF